MKEGARAAQVEILAFLSIIYVPSLFTRQYWTKESRKGA